MTEGLAIEIAKYKMMELGYGEDYTLRFRHLILKFNEAREMELSNDWMILISPLEQIKVQSKTGILNLTDNEINEQQYIHSGVIKLTNLNTKLPTGIKFLQVIPTNDRS